VSLRSVTSTNTRAGTSSSSSSGLSGGAIAGIVIGCVVGALVILALLFFFCCSAWSGTKKDNHSFDEVGHSQPVGGVEHSQVEMSHVDGEEHTAGETA